MSEPDVKFYNMLLHLIKNNKIYEENVAVKNVWEKDGNTFLDIYFYRRRKSYIFDSVFVHDIYDRTTEKYYKNIKDFAKDFMEQIGMAEKAPEQADVWEMVDQKIFEPIDVDLLLLAYMARAGQNYTPLKQHIILDYILDNVPQTRSLSQQYLNTYIESLKPDEKGFYEAIAYIDYRRPDKVKNLCQEILKVCLSDGRLHYREKLRLAEILQSCREAGINIDLGV